MTFMVSQNSVVKWLEVLSKNAQLGKYSTTNIFTKSINPGITTARPFFLVQVLCKAPWILISVAPCFRKCFSIEGRI